MQKEHGRKHLTKEQMRQVLARKDAVAEKNIPDSARRQMAHRPYRKKGEDADGAGKGREREKERVFEKLSDRPPKAAGD